MISKFVAIMMAITVPLTAALAEETETFDGRVLWVDTSGTIHILESDGGDRASSGVVHVVHQIGLDIEPDVFSRVIAGRDVSCLTLYDQEERHLVDCTVRVFSHLDRLLCRESFGANCDSSTGMTRLLTTLGLAEFGCSDVDLQRIDILRVEMINEITSYADWCNSGE